MELKVRELVEILESQLVGDQALLDQPVRLVMDSRKVSEGDIFWAIKGENFDAHNFVVDVQERGVEMVVLNQDWIIANPNTVKAYIPVKNTEKAMLKLAKGYAHRFSATKIAITGSNGKTTTKDMIHKVLSTCKTGYATEGNFNNHIGVPLTLFKLKHEHDYAIVEMGTNHPGEIQVLTQTAQPQIAVITNIGQSHLEFFHNEENVFKEKTTIAKGLTRGGYLVVNADDQYLSTLKSTSKYKLVTFGVNNGQVRPKDLTWDDNACARFKIGRTEYQLSTPGIHNLYNALAAIAVGGLMKVPKSKIAGALMGYAGSSLRMEIKELGRFKVAADCYNANPSSTSMALQTISQMKCEGRRIAVLGDMLELGENRFELHAELGNHLAEQGFDFLFTVGEAAEHIAKRAIERGMSIDSVSHYMNNDDLIDSLQSLVGEGDVVLVKASRGLKLDQVVSALEKMEGAK